MDLQNVREQILVGLMILDMSTLKSKIDVIVFKNSAETWKRNQREKH